MWGCKKDVSDIRGAFKEPGADFISPSELEEVLEGLAEESTGKPILPRHYSESTLVLVQPCTEFQVPTENIFREAVYDPVPYVALAVRLLFCLVLESIDGTKRLEATDDEPDLRRDRLELLAVVRGLEALDQPSKVTLITPSRYVFRGFRLGLSDWRTNNWRWERFGRMTFVRHGDLWRRIDQAMKFHTVECRRWRFELPEDESTEIDCKDLTSAG